MRTLLLATTNAHKTAEIRALLGDLWEVADLRAYPDAVAPEETGETFEANAILKACAAAKWFSGLVLADDSGLEVDALNGAPGVRSARYAGENASDAENCQKLLRQMNIVSARGKERSARFRCAMALVNGENVLTVCHGAVEGTIINQLKGDGGFGYDPLFVPHGHCETFAQLDSAVKNKESHRGHALEKMRAFLQTHSLG